jgi:hypothetical protein
MVIELPFLNIKKGGVAQMRKQLVFMSIILAVFFLNSCAAVGIIAGGGTLGCVVYEDVNKERCPALVEIDENLKN